MKQGMCSLMPRQVCRGAFRLFSIFSFPISPAMKKFHFTILLVIGFQICSAQLDIGLKAGPAYTNVKGNGTKDNTSVFGLFAGATSRISLSKKIVLSPELLYWMKGFKYLPDYLYSASVQRLHYLSVPLLVGYKFTNNIAILAGPEQISYQCK